MSTAFNGAKVKRGEMKIIIQDTVLNGKSKDLEEGWSLLERRKGKDRLRPFSFLTLPAFRTDFTAVLMRFEYESKLLGAKRGKTGNKFTTLSSPVPTFMALKNQHFWKISQRVKTSTRGVLS